MREFCLYVFSKGKVFDGDVLRNFNRDLGDFCFFLLGESLLIWRVCSFLGDERGKDLEMFRDFVFMVVVSVYGG